MLVMVKLPRREGGRENQRQRAMEGEPNTRAQAWREPGGAGGISIILTAQRASQVDAEAMARKLGELGLRCDEATPQAIEDRAWRMLGKLRTGRLSSFGIYTDTGALPVEGEVPPVDSVGRVVERRYREVAQGLWRESRMGLYTRKLLVLQAVEHRRALSRYFRQLPYGEHTLRKRFSAASLGEAVEQLVQLAGQAMEQAAGECPSRVSYEACFHDIPLSLERSAGGYRARGNRVMVLVADYDPACGVCSGVGVLGCEWQLKAERGDTGLQCRVVLSTRCLVYTKVRELELHYAWLMSRAGFPPLLLAEPTLPRYVCVYDALPPANAATYMRSFPCVAQAAYADVLVFYRMEETLLLEHHNPGREPELSRHHVRCGMQGDPAAELDPAATAYFVAAAGCKKPGRIAISRQQAECHSKGVSIFVPAQQTARVYDVVMHFARLRLCYDTGEFIYVARNCVYATGTYRLRLGTS